MRLKFAVVLIALIAAAAAEAAPPPVMDDGHVQWADRRSAMLAIRRYSHPPYPLKARQERRQLASILRLYVAPNGKVTRTRPLVMTGDQALLDYAQDYIRLNYQFPRPVVAGRPARVFFDLPVVFEKSGYTADLRAQVARLGPAGARLLKILDEEMRKDAESERLRRSIRVPTYGR